MNSNYLIVVDRGNVCAYRAGSGPEVRLVRALELADAQGGKGQPAEEDTGRIKLLARTVNWMLEQDQVDAWSLAAVPELHPAIFEEIEPEYRKRIVNNLPFALDPISQTLAGKSRILGRLGGGFRAG